jgi:hypothetical protein
MLAGQYPADEFADLKPRITLRTEDGEVLQLANGLEARYFLSVDAILSVQNGQKVQAGDYNYVEKQARELDLLAEQQE